MAKSKTFTYDYKDYMDNKKGPSTMIAEILQDPEISQWEELIIGVWGEVCCESCQAIIDGIIENKERFSHIQKLFFGDMSYEECEVSWIIQGNYQNLWNALPQLKELTIKGSTDLKLGTIEHESLESLTIICGGLPTNVIESIRDAKLPNLNKLLLYLGSDDYGFEGDENTIKDFLEKSNFPKLEYLGIVDSEIQDEVTSVVLKSQYMNQIHTLDLSCGTLSDKGGELLLNTITNYPNINTLDIHFNFLSEDMIAKLEALPLTVDASERNEADIYDGEPWMYAMLTE